MKELDAFYEEKEELYRTICRNRSEKCGLTTGAAEFLDFLLTKNIPRTIATASYLPNVEMYFELFNLQRWFDINQVIYDSGRYRGKPHPDMFLAASLMIGVPIHDCMIIEDSRGGVQAARNAGAGIIIAVDFEGNRDKFQNFSFIDEVISDFRELLYIFS